MRDIRRRVPSASEAGCEVATSEECRQRSGSISPTLLFAGYLRLRCGGVTFTPLNKQGWFGTCRRPSQRSAPQPGRRSPKIRAGQASVSPSLADRRTSRAGVVAPPGGPRGPGAWEGGLRTHLLGSGLGPLPIWLPSGRSTGGRSGGSTTPARSLLGPSEPAHRLLG